jgi:hypothetical protein
MRQPQGLARCEVAGWLGGDWVRARGGGSAGGREAPYVAGDGSSSTGLAVGDVGTARAAKWMEGMQASAAGIDSPGYKVSNP